jgi:hypothetical protein
MSDSSQPSQDGVPRRRFLAGVGAGAAGLSIAGAAAPAAPASEAAGQQPFPDRPTANTTTTEDRLQMLWQLGISQPTLPPRAEDANRPPNATPVDASAPEGNWTDPLGHTVTRSNFGQWVTYDDSAGAAGGAVSPEGPYGPFSHPRYPDVPLLRTNDGSPVRTPADWWTKRRPEVLRDVQEHLYGPVPDRDRWPAITWSASPVTTGTANGVAYRERIVTGILDTSGYPAVRNAPVLRGTLRTPQDAAGQPVPVIIVFGGTNTEWEFTAPYGYGVCAFDYARLQPDTGGAALSSYLIGLINQGNWRLPGDWGALGAWSWGVSRLIDYFETDPDVDATRIGLQGHSRFGKATLVSAAYDERIAAAYPSCAGALGTSWARMTWGENLELVCSADTEYHWVNGTIMRYAGERTPGTYWPRKVWDLPVDAHSVMSLIAPRVVMTNGGTDTPPGTGDAWQNPRGMYLAGAVSSEVWRLLGWPGLVIPPDTPFTSGPGEAVGGTPPVDTAFIDGPVGWRRHHEGHTPTPDWPAFMSLTVRHLDTRRPVVAPGQHFAPGGRSAVVGRAHASGGTGGSLGNWQITGGSGAGGFAIDPATGEITRVRQAGRRSRGTYTLTLVVDDRRLSSPPETVTIRLPDAD